MTRWLTPPQLQAWMRLEAVVELLPGVLDGQLLRDAGLTHFQYLVMAKLSEADRRALRMTQLAASTNATLPRLSHVVSNLEERGYVERRACPGDRRATLVHLTDAGMDKVVATAPGHVANVRRYVIDRLTDTQVTQLDQITAALLEELDPDDQLAVNQGIARNAAAARANETVHPDRD